MHLIPLSSFWGAVHFLGTLGYVGIGTMRNKNKDESGHVFMIYDKDSGDVNFVKIKDNGTPSDISDDSPIYGTIPLWISLAGINTSKEIIAELIELTKNNWENGYTSNNSKKYAYKFYFNFYYYINPVALTYDFFSNYGFTTLNF
ncbi:MAG: hypothetical protein AMQ22_02143 [Candidatus Methanofastidiosum methylothiophilum]|uniref:Uncharacterized protein n=1 Tax=Candidatus Methanofastidiosum methylothiophilum TaxID=1705564 RepID=A0A150IN15_9EURY|nr:MAG: hypothetical protein AMQ22_02143 [Candidatus Methanofastidiosum methylthiophilus]